MVSVSHITDAFNNNDKIQLIKLYREHTGKGLKDSKDAIETVLPYNSSDSYWDGKLPELLALFDISVKAQEDDMLKAFMVMKDSWKELGFKSFKNGVLTILDNF